MADRAKTALEKDGDFHAEEVLDRPFDRDLSRRLLRYVLPYRRYLLFSLGLILATTLFSLAGPILVKEAIDGPLSLQPHSGLLSGIADAVGATDDDGQEARHRWLIAIVGIYVLLIILQFGARYAQTIVMHLTGQNVTRDLRMQVFRHLQERRVDYFQRHPVGRLVTRVTSDIESLNELFTTGVVTFVSDLLTVLGIMLLMVAVNPTLAGIALSITPFLVAITLVFRTMARRHYREVRRKLAHLNAFTQESITGMDVIQISRQEEAQAARYRAINTGLMEAWIKSVFWYAIFFPLVDVLMMVAVALVVTYSGSQLLSEVPATTFGDFFLFWTYLNRIFMPIRGLAERYNTLQSAMASAERIFGVLDETAVVPEPTAPAAPVPLREAIRFEDVTFSYNQGQPVLRGVSFSLKRGETVALVGATGAGKSTIVNLLLRFYDPTRGRIFLDQIDLRQFPLRGHRERFGLVLQDVAVFSRSILENIDLDRGISEEVLLHAASQVHVDSFAAKQERGYGEVMRERGRTLSSGERQLLAFARALAGDPEFLVLDEATSHIDTGTEALIQDALEQLLEGRTSLVVAHRLSTIRHADRILVFHHGELREEGTHEELLEKGEVYARLYRLQFGLEASEGRG